MSGCIRRVTSVVSCVMRNPIEDGTAIIFPRIPTVVLGATPIVVWLFDDFAHYFAIIV